MSKIPWTAVWAALVFLAGLGSFLVTRPAPLPAPVQVSIDVGKEQAAPVGARRSQRPAAEGSSDIVVQIDLLRDRYVALADENWDEWDSDASGALSWPEFIGGLDAAVKLPVALQELLPDLSGDGMVTRDEARGTMEMLLGVRLLGSQPLRLPRPAELAAGRAAVLPMGWRQIGNISLRSASGHVLNVIHFRQLDLDRSGALDARELGNLGLAGLDPATVLAECDTDQDGQVALAEWWHVPIAGSADTRNEFLTLDANQDGYLDRNELQHVPGYKLKVAEHALPSFDLDGNGMLSLDEYRFTPLANPLVDWNRDIVDGDGNLTFAEYIDRSEPFVLLYWNYFRRFDLNSDGALDEDEYTFRSPPRKALYTLNADGTAWGKLCEVPGYTDCGSPKVSPDGKTVALDAHPVLEQGQVGTPMIFTVDIESRHVRPLCQGQMPTWSVDGKFFACSRVEGNAGVWIMTADGQEYHQVGSGWSGQWSPDGKQIAYYQGSQLLVYEVETGQIRDVLGTDHAYRQVFWNMCWSPDSRQICFKGLAGDGQEDLVLVDAAGAERGIKVRYRTTNLFPKFAWHPYESRLVFCMPCRERHVVQLYELDPKTDGPPVLVRGQDPNAHNADPCWTPNGQRLILVSHRR
jgi:hypothetical protein